MAALLCILCLCYAPGTLNCLCFPLCSYSSAIPLSIQHYYVLLILLELVVPTSTYYYAHYCCSSALPFAPLPFAPFRDCGNTLPQRMHCFSSWNGIGAEQPFMGWAAAAMPTFANEVY